MNKITALTKIQQFFTVILSIIISSLAVWGAVSGATTISANITTGGTISLSSGSPLAFSSSATSTIPNNLVNVWSIATSSGAEPIISIDTTSGAGGSASGGSVGIGTAYMPSKLTVKGSDGWTSVSALNASDEEVVAFGARTNGTGVLQITNSDETVTTLFRNDGTAGYILSGDFGFGTSTPGAKLAVQGAGIFSGDLNAANVSATGTLTVSGVFTATSTATTTLALQSDSNSEGACIQIRGTNGAIYRMYFSPADAIGTATTSSRGGTAYIALWEAGTCQ